jgi:succinate dehydrogenase / fumarate reductase membrane anchor subunit
MGNGTSIGRVRGLGSAKAGAHHFWHQRLTAGSNLLLMAWLILSLALLPDYGYDTVLAWVGSAWGAVPLLLLATSVFYHAKLGLTTVIEDYQHDATRIVALVALNLVYGAGWLLTVFSILRIAFTGTPA